MQTDEIGISVKDCRVSKLLSNTAGCPAKKFDEKASKFMNLIALNADGRNWHSGKRS